MTPAMHRVRLATLVREELRALPRNRFALAGLAVACLALALLGAFTTDGPNEMAGFVALFWIVGPLFVPVFVAARVAAARRTRFVDSLYTTPLAPATWLAAHAVVAFVMVGIAIAALLPFVAVHAAYLGVPEGLSNLLLASIFLGSVAVGWGLLAGVLVGEAGPGAAASIAAAMGAFSFAALFIHDHLLGTPALSAGKAALLQLVHLSPAVLALDAAGSNLFGYAARERLPAALGLAAMAAGFFVAAALVVARHQSPLGWERRPGRALLAALLAGAFVVPGAVATIDYEESAEERTRSFVMDGDYAITLVARGAKVDDQAMTRLQYLDRPALVVGETASLDLLILLRVPADATVRNLRVTLDGGSSLEVTGGLSEVLPHAAGQARESKGFGYPGDGVGPLSPVFRVPVTIRALETNSLVDGRLPLNVTASFVVDGEQFESFAVMPVYVGVAHASVQLLAAGAILPLLSIGSVVRRSFRTR